MPGVSRRGFLLGGAVAVAGCSRGPRLDPATRTRIQTDLQSRATFLAARTPIAGPFTTPTPPVDLLTTAPELKGLAKLAYRMHPVAAAFESLSHTESHFGGPLDWPAEVPFPANDAGQLLVPVLQLRADDAPGQVRFKPGSDLLHLFWDARFVERLPRDRMTVRCVWGKAGAGATPHPLAGLGERPADTAWLAERLWPGYVPVPARLNPERLLEFPGDDVLPERMKAKLFPSLPGGAQMYRETLSVAPGSKVGGYAPAQPEGLPPACPTCQWGMSYLLTVSEAEHPESGGRWRATPTLGRNPMDLSLGPMGMVNLFVCRRCPDWPCGWSC